MNTQRNIRIILEPLPFDPKKPIYAIRMHVAYYHAGLPRLKWIRDASANEVEYRAVKSELDAGKPAEFYKLFCAMNITEKDFEKYGVTEKDGTQ